MEKQQQHRALSGHGFRVSLKTKKILHKSWKFLYFIAFSLRVDSWSSLNRNLLGSLVCVVLFFILPDGFLSIREHLRVSLSWRAVLTWECASSPSPLSYWVVSIKNSIWEEPNNNVDDARCARRRSDLCLILLILLCNLQCSLLADRTVKYIHKKSVEKWETITRVKRGGLKNVKEQSTSGYSDSEESSRQQANYIQSWSFSGFTRIVTIVN